VGSDIGLHSPPNILALERSSQHILKDGAYYVVLVREIGRDHRANCLIVAGFIAGRSGSNECSRSPLSY
jgi:hypothetical protein